jgi:hypothetical protein
LVALALSSLGLGAREARAQGTETFVPCALHGRALMPLNTPVTDAGGRPVARFGGPETALVVSGFSTAARPRARIETGVGQGGFRVRGFVDAAALPVATSEDVPVVAGHVWIGARRAVTVVAATPDKLKIEKRLTAPLNQTFTAFTSCRKLLLGNPVPPGWSPPGDARGYAWRGSSLALRDAARGNVVTTLYKATATPAVLFHGTEGSGGWVRLEYHGEIVLDAWALPPEVQALPRGETLDQLAPPASARNPARLAVPGAPRVVKASRELALRAAAKDGESIGVIEAGAEVYVVDVVAGWASVLPRALDVVPPENGRFWVKKEELGI